MLTRPHTHTQEPKSREDFFMNLQSHWNVKSKQVDGATRLCGLIVMEEHARRFVNGPPGERKTMEIRKTNFTNYLSAGERILLISCGGRRGPSEGDSSRKILGILEYQDGLRIKNTMINQFYSAHRISAEEVDAAFSAWMGTQDYCFGLCFSLVHAFDEPTSLCGNQSSRIWNWVPCDALNFGGKHDLSIARSDTNSSLGNPSSLSSYNEKAPLSNSQEPSGSHNHCKRSYSEMLVGPQEDIADSDEEQNEQNDPDDVNMANELHDDSKLLCLCINDTEWLKIRAGESCFLYRSYQCKTDAAIIVMIRKPEGHVVVGQITVSEKTQVVTSAKTSVLAEQCQNMYSTSELQKLKGNKSLWLWKLSAVDEFETPHACKFLELAPRFRNRPFHMSKAELASTAPASIPRRLHLLDTGRFFVDLLSEERRQALDDLLRGLNKQVIRVGTTCSGTDVCVKALKELVNTFNEMQDCMDAWLFRMCFLKIHHIQLFSMYIYIYIYSCVYIYLCEYVFNYVYINCCKCMCMNINCFKRIKRHSKMSNNGRTSTSE